MLSRSLFVYIYTCCRMNCDGAGRQNPYVQWLWFVLVLIFCAVSIRVG
jgi:hypothetical protein